MVNTPFLTATGAKVGGGCSLSSGRRHLTVRITGEIFEPAGGSPEILGSRPALAALDPQLVATQYDVALKPGTEPAAYASAAGHALGPNYQLNVQSDSNPQVLAILGLVGALMLLLAAVAGLGVLNTVVLQTRE